VGYERTKPPARKAQKKKKKASQGRRFEGSSNTHVPPQPRTPAAVASVNARVCPLRLFGFGPRAGLLHWMAGVAALDRHLPRAARRHSVCHLSGGTGDLVWRQIIRTQAAQAAEAYKERSGKPNPGRRPRRRHADGAQAPPIAAR